MKRYENKVVLVTGGSAGIGRAIASAFAREGARVVITGRNAANGASAVQALRAQGADVEFVAGDAADEAHARAAVEHAVQRYGRLDVAVNNAGVEGELGPVAEASAANYDHVFGVNVKGLLFAMKHEIAALAKNGGAIVNVSSALGDVGMAGAAIYAASKHAVNGLTRSVALETAQQGIRVNVVAPGGVRTDMLERFTGGNADAQAGLAAAHPVGRLGHPDEIASAVLYLASDDARFTTGSVLTVDGGYTAA